MNRIREKMTLALAEKDRLQQRMVQAYYMALAGAVMTAACTTPAYAITASNGLKAIFTKVGDAFKDIYNQIVLISTSLAVCMLAICLLIRMFSKNQRSVEEATQWAKRICISWLLLNSLMFLFNYGSDLVKQGGFGNQAPTATW